MTYGEHQEAAAAALLHLLNATQEHDKGEDVGTTLACRRQIHLALHDRLHELGIDRHLERPHGALRRVSSARYPLHVLSGLMHEMPIVGIDHRPPSVLLAGPAVAECASAGDLWRAAGRHLMLGNAELSGTLDQTWRSGPGWWYLLGDLATTVEAMIVLDQSLAHAGHLPPRSRISYLDARLAAGDVARVGSWRGTDPAADLAFAPALGSDRTLGAGPRVHLVRRPEDFAIAQRTLAGFVRPRHRDDVSDRFDERPGLLAARTIAEGQVRLADAFATWAEHAGAAQLADRFRARIPKYVELHRSTLRLVELQKTRTPLVVMQQSELVQRLRNHRVPQFSLTSLHDLDDATHELTVHTGRALRREGRARKNLLILDTDRVGPPGARPITNCQERFTLACRDLASEGHSKVAPQELRRGHRSRLTRTLTHLDVTRWSASANGRI